MKSLGLNKSQASAVLSQVQLILAVSETAGDKGIPKEAWNLLPDLEPVNDEMELLSRVDAILCSYFGFRSDELFACLNFDVVVYAND